MVNMDEKNYYFCPGEVFVCNNDTIIEYKFQHLLDSGDLVWGSIDEPMRVLGLDSISKMISAREKSQAKRIPAITSRKEILLLFL